MQIRRLIGAGSACLTITLFATTAIPQTADRSGCVDLVVIGKLVEQEPTPFPGGLIMQWPWELTVNVEQVLYGTVSTERVTFTMLLHAQIIDQRFMFMLHRTATGYVTAEISEPIYRAVKDRGGKLMMPIPEPLTSDDLSPKSWIPVDYEQYLLPINYDYREFELDQPPRWENEYKAGSNWLTKSGDHIYAKRGLPLDGVPNFLARSGLNCR